MLNRLRLACLTAVIAATAACSRDPIPQGGEQQHCFRNATCDVGLICLSDICVRPPDGGMSGGRGGTTAGAGGIAGGAAAGTTGGSIAGSAGSGGATAGTGGSVGGGGATGAAGATAGAGGSTGGGTAGRGGATGAGGATGGRGGATGGRGGSTGAGGTGGVWIDACGNGVLNAGEACDDGNRTAGDGCTSICQVPAGWMCSGTPSVCSMVGLCGDGILGANEACDDNNTASGDGCSGDCRTVEPGYECRVPGRRCVPACGDGMRIGGEACDDSNQTAGDGCSSVCQIEPGASCTTLAGGKSTCIASICGNGMKEGNEGCDCGTSNTTFPVGCKGPNGLFFGDATGCSNTCTKEPSCRTAAGVTQACATSCGNGAVEMGEGCDDGNNAAGDGCSPTCTVEGGFMCGSEMRDDTTDCTQPGNTGKCLELPMVYRDFKNESVSGGHPDFFYMGASVANPVNEAGVQGQTGTTSFSKRYCVPNASGPAKKQDSTSRCWDIAMSNLAGANGKPAFNASRTGGTDCDCQFIDWSHDTNGGHVPGYTLAANSPLNGLIYTDGASGHPMYRGPAPIVTSATTFGQWWVDSAYTGNTHTVGTLEMRAIGGGQYQYSSQLNLVTGGFFPLDPPAHGFPLYMAAPAGPGAPPLMVGTEAMLCNLWPYWYSSTVFGAGSNCRGDQYLFPPGLIPPDTTGVCPAGMNCNGKWYVNQQGWFHDFWFTHEARYLFTYDGDFTLQFVGADDMFIFINGIQVVDLGGIHQALPGRVTVTGATGMATIIEGGSLDASQTNILPCTGADPYTGVTFNLTTGNDGNGHMNCTNATCDCRTRTVPLGLTMGRTYEIAVFGAERQPIESAYQLTFAGLQTIRSNCMPRCGDGIRTGAEECDCGDANTSSTDPSCAGLHNQDSLYGGCTTMCKYGPYCGDGVVDPPREECDNGSRNNNVTYGNRDGCAPGCRYPHFCGDAIVDEAEGEQCDLGANNGQLGLPCPTTCKILLP